MTKPRGARGAVQRAFERACLIYDQVATVLTLTLTDLQAQAEAAGAPDRALLDTIRAHQKAVLTVMDFEAQLLKRRIGARRSEGGKLDLDAARREVAGRLARLEAAGDA